MSSNIPPTSDTGPALNKKINKFFSNNKLQQISTIQNENDNQTII